MGQLRSRARPVVALKVYVCSLAKTLANSPGLLRVARHQVFVDPFRTCRNQTAVLIEAEQDDPIVDRTWPFTVWQKAFGICAESTEKVRDVRVTPTDQNHF